MIVIENCNSLSDLRQKLIDGEEVRTRQEPYKVSEYDKDHIWYKGNQYISLRRFLEVKAEAEKEPCEDAISRQAVIDGINRYFHDEYCQRTSIQDCRDYLIEDVINKLPSVKPQEPCEDEYIKVPKKALKYRTAGMVAYNAEWLKNHFDIERAVICGAQEPTTMNDLALIHTEGLDEEIRCAMCTNSMKSNRGCDGSCVVNKDMYKAVMDAIEKRIQPTTKNDVPENNVGDIYECSCGYGWDKSKVVRHHFCPNCGRAVEPSYNSIKTNLKPCDECRRWKNDKIKRIYWV